MPLQIVNGRQITGAYQGQRTPILLGAVANTFHERGPQAGQHLVGLNADAENLFVNAYYDVTALLNNQTIQQSASRISYFQAGQITLNGMPIPIQQDVNQFFFPARNPVKLSPLGQFDAGRDYWWMDALLDDRDDLFYPVRGIEVDERANINNLNMWPKAMGNWMTNPLQHLFKEALAPSALVTASLANMPEFNLPDTRQQAFTALENAQDFSDQNRVGSTLLANVQAQFFNFANTILGLIRGANYTLVFNPLIQWMGRYENDGNPFMLFAVRGNFASDSGTGERAYGVRVMLNTRETTITVVNVPDGLTADETLATIWSGVTSQQPWTILNEPYTMPVEYGPVLDYYNQLQALLQNQNNPSVTVTQYWELQVFEPYCLLRGTFINNQEQVFLGRFNANTPDQMDWYWFSRDAYMSALTNDLEFDQDPLNLNLTANLEEFDPLTDQAEYTPNQLVQFMQNQGVNVQLNPNDAWRIQLRYVTCVGAYNEQNQTIYLHDAFCWQFYRDKPQNSQVWGAVSVDPNQDFGTRVNARQHLRDLILASPQFTEENINVILDL